MSDCQLTEDTIDNVIDIIREISFKGIETTSIAKRRDEYMREFLKEFQDEWNAQ